MFPAKAPAITVQIEQRIRRGFYQDTLPVNDFLQNEFMAAKQTVTEALRPLFASGVLQCSSPRNGIRIDREKLQTGTIAVVSGVDMGLEDRTLVREMKLDKFSVRVFLPSDFVKFRAEEAEKFCGVLFINSALTVEMAAELEKRKVPFVSCNRTDFAPEVSSIDYNQEANIRFVLEYLMSRNYRKIGFFYTSPLKGYNLESMKIVRRQKRELGLPVEFFDRFTADWDKSAERELEKLIGKCYREKSFPEILVAKYNAVPQLTRVIDKSIFPGKMHFIFHRAQRERIPAVPGVYTFYFSRSNWHLWLMGYELLRERMLYPERKVQHRYAPVRIIMDNPVAGNIHPIFM